MSKALGQFFTPDAVAEVAAAFVYSLVKPLAVLDPMSGQGALLKAIFEEAKNRKLPSPRLFGIEIDPALVAKSEDAVPGATIVNADAFSRLASFESVDAVIGNPPYVRYQRLGDLAGHLRLKVVGRKENPNTIVAEAIRERTLQLGSSSGELAAAWRALVLSYPTRADISTAAWLAMWPKLRDGGVFAFIVPKTWDTRDYGLLLEYYLLRFFDLRAVVHVGTAMSFSGAQVAIDLVVAQRRSTDRASGGLFSAPIPPDVTYNEYWLDNQEQASSLARFLRYGEGIHRLRSRLSSLEEIRQRLLSRINSAPTSTARALHKIEDTSVIVRASSRSSWAGSVIGAKDWITAEEFGLTINQGLRTGCNDFFYARVLGPGRGAGLVRIEVPILGPLGQRNSVVEVPRGVLLPCVRYAQDMPRFVLRQRDPLPWSALRLQENVPEGLKRAVRAAEDTPVLVKGRMALIPELSALKLNGSGRRWYSLDIRPRHRGDLFVARINDGTVLCYLNDEQSSLVDANFSTITMPLGVSKTGMLAFLNSTPARLLIEGLGTAMGGGALKIEAVQLRRLAMPTQGDRRWELLSECGDLITQLSNKIIPNDLQRRIDNVLITNPPEEKFTVTRLAERLAAVVNWRRNRNSCGDASSAAIPSICADAQLV